MRNPPRNLYNFQPGKWVYTLLKIHTSKHFKPRNQPSNDGHGTPSYQRCGTCSHPWRIHDAIYGNMDPIKKTHVSIYTSTMDPMGDWSRLKFHGLLWSGSGRGCLGHVAAQEGNAGQNLQLTPGHAIPRPCEIHGCVWKVVYRYTQNIWPF
jgi:hypothetical protein